MKQIPMLFSTPMVQAIIEGRKTQTRRIAAVPVGDHHGIDIMDWGLSKHPHQKDGKWLYSVQSDVDDHDTFELKPKYGQPGDLLYAREEHYRYGHWVEKEGVYTKTGRQKWMFVPTTDEVRYYNNKPEIIIGRDKNMLSRPGWYKRLARFMPKSTARIWLQVTGVKVERLQGITEEDAKAEGVEPVPSFNSGEGVYPGQKYKNYLPNGYTEVLAKHSFESLWISINGPESWNENPWVWCVGFKVLSTTGKPSLITENKNNE